MKNKCRGIAGYLFGHCYTKFIVYDDENNLHISEDIYAWPEIQRMVDKLENLKYKIVCSRCGEEK